MMNKITETKRVLARLTMGTATRNDRERARFICESRREDLAKLDKIVASNITAIAMGKKSFQRKEKR
jgi:hypothetical protein